MNEYPSIDLSSTKTNKEVGNTLKKLSFFGNHDDHHSSHPFEFPSLSKFEQLNADVTLKQIVLIRNAFSESLTGVHLTLSDS